MEWLYSILATICIGMFFYMLIFIVTMFIEGFAGLFKSKVSGDGLSSIGDCSDSNSVIDVSLKKNKTINDNTNVYSERRVSYWARGNFRTFKIKIEDVIKLVVREFVHIELPAYLVTIKSLSHDKKSMIILLLKEMIFHYQATSNFEYSKIFNKKRRKKDIAVSDTELIWKIDSALKQYSRLHTKYLSLSRRLYSCSCLEYNKDCYINLVRLAATVFISILIIPFVEKTQTQFFNDLYEIYSNLGLHSDNVKTCWKNDNISEIAKTMDANPMYFHLFFTSRSFSYYASLELEGIDV